MVWPHSADLLTALTGDHEMEVRIDVFDPTGIRAERIPFESGEITATLLSDVCRSGRFTVPRRVIQRGLLDPRRDRVRILTGVPGFPLVPIFTGRVTDVTPTDSGHVQAEVEDFGRDVVDADFEFPWATTELTSVATEVQRLLYDVDPSFGLDASRALFGQTPGLVWEDDRAAALDQLTAGINCIWQANRVGSFTLFPNPFNLTTPPPVVFWLSDGPSGTISTWAEHRTRDKAYNAVTVLVERTDGTPPIRATARDTSPASPFRWGGPYGKVHRKVRLQTPGGVGEARLVAERILRQSLALARSWWLTTPHFPLLDPGDVIGVSTNGDIETLVVESVRYPLEAVTATTITARQLRHEVVIPE